MDFLVCESAIQDHALTRPDSGDEVLDTSQIRPLVAS